jgi:hypothetical protein
MSNDKTGKELKNIRISLAQILWNTRNRVIKSQSDMCSVVRFELPLDMKSE